MSESMKIDLSDGPKGRVPLNTWLGLEHRTDANAGLPQRSHLLRTAAALLTDGDVPTYDAALVDLLNELGLFEWTEDKSAMLATLLKHAPDRRPEHSVEVRVRLRAETSELAVALVRDVLAVGDDDGDLTIDWVTSP